MIMHALTLQNCYKRIEGLGWFIVPHTPYSPDEAPLDFSLFRSLEHFLRRKVFNKEEEIRQALDEYFKKRGFLSSRI
jgi:hypothetical protein